MDGVDASGGECHLVLRIAGLVAALRCGRGIPVRPHRTAVLLVRHRAVRPGGTSSGTGLVPTAGRKPRPGPRRSVPEVAQAATGASAGSTSVHEEPSSADRVTASSTSWTCNASAKDGAGSTPVAIASMKSRIWWVNECS